MESSRPHPQLALVIGFLYFIGVGVHGLIIIHKDPRINVETVGTILELVYAGAVMVHLTMRGLSAGAGIYIGAYVCVFLMLGSVLIIDVRYWVNLIIGLILALHWPQGSVVQMPDMC